jgi:DNA-directed RNA polymerase subunit RPC12/RpoP
MRLEKLTDKIQCLFCKLDTYIHPNESYTICEHCLSKIDVKNKIINR